MVVTTMCIYCLETLAAEMHRPSVVGWGPPHGASWPILYRRRGVVGRAAMQAPLLRSLPCLRAGARDT